MKTKVLNVPNTHESTAKTQPAKSHHGHHSPLGHDPVKNTAKNKRGGHQPKTVHHESHASHPKSTL